MTKFSAQEPSLGYHYQIRYALYLLLKSKSNENTFIKLENLDDVEIGDLNKTDLYQTKFHNNKAANLTDNSSDIWKTIRVWSEMTLLNQIDLDNVLLFLVTTSKASEKSILYNLRENRLNTKSIKDIVSEFNLITINSKSGKDPNTKGDGLQKEFEAYNRLSESQKEKLFSAIHIQDRALTFDDLKREIKKELQLSFLPKHIEGAFQDLQGWWYEQCIQHLQSSKDSITYNETRNYILYLNDKLKSESLPIDTNIKEATVNEKDYQDRLFIAQLQEIHMGNNTIKQAKRDFYRASEQRSKWIRELLLNPQEEIDYDFKLKDDWRRKFSSLQDDIEDKPEEIKTEKCGEFYKNFYIYNTPQIFIKPNVVEHFIVTGSCHILADKKDMVWHPKYLKENI